jgi:pimeloyl-ACP methyl ester carboxylesterase
MFSPSTPEAVVAEFGEALRGFHPMGFRTMARAAAEDLRGALSTIDVPTLLVFGDADERAPTSVAEALHSSIPGSTLTVLSGVGHVCNLEAVEPFNRVVRDFLRAHS